MGNNKQKQRGKYSLSATTVSKSSSCLFFHSPNILKPTISIELPTREIVTCLLQPKSSLEFREKPRTGELKIENRKSRLALINRSCGKRLKAVRIKGNFFDRKSWLERKRRKLDEFTFQWFERKFLKALFSCRS
jgi:hypothetical protein